MQLYVGILIAAMFAQWGVSTMIAQSCLVHSQSINMPRQEYPGLRSYDAMLRGGQHATHHPVSLPYSTGPCRLGRRYEARRRQRQPPLPAQPMAVALLPGAGAQGLDSGRHGGAGEDCSRGAGEGRRDGQAPAASR